MKLMALTLVLLVAATVGGHAAPQSGTFTATAECEALRSMRKGTNPGQVRTEIGRAYEVIETSRSRGGAYRIVVTGAPDIAERWVKAACGTFFGGTAPSGNSDGVHVDDANAAGGDAESTHNVLAVSWHPAFCELSPRRDECRRGAAGLSVHGLWPQPRDKAFCGPQGERYEGVRWSRIPEPDLSGRTRRALQPLMPGIESNLHRYQWAKHGTCYGAAGGADEYYADTVRVMAQLNASDVARVMVDHAGRRITARAIRDAFDEAFGPGAGARVEVVCDADPDSGRTLILELRIALRGRITDRADLGALIRAAAPRRPGCDGGIVDPVGNQA